MNIFIEDSWLVVDDREQKIISVNIEGLVYQIESVQFTIITEYIVFLIRIGQLDRFLSNQIVDLSFDIWKYETVIAYPHSALNNIRELVNELESFLVAIIVLIFFVGTLIKLRRLFWADVVLDSLVIKIEKVVIVFEGENNLLTIFTPEHVFGRRTNIYASDNYLGFPVIKSDEFLALNWQ